MQVLVSFIGKGREAPAGCESGSRAGYEQATYDFQDGSSPIPAAFFGAALLRHLHRTGSKKVDTWLVMGTALSNWADVSEACANRPPDSEWQVVRDAARSGAITQDLLATWEAILQRNLPQTHLLLRLTGALDTRTSQELAWGALEEAIEPESSVILDITHGFRHQGVIVAFMLMLMRWVRSIGSLDLFYGALELRDRATGVSPVLHLPICNELLEANEAAATLRNTGDFVPLARWIPVDMRVRRTLERVAYLEETYQEPRAEATRASSSLEAVTLSPIAASLAELIRERLRWVRHEALPERLAERARFAFDRGQYLRAFVLIFEAVVSAAAGWYLGAEDLTGHEVRQRAVNALSRGALNSKDLTQVWMTLKDTRNAVVHGTRPNNQDARTALSNPDGLRVVFEGAQRLLREILEAPIRAEEAGTHPRA